MEQQRDSPLSRTVLLSRYACRSASLSLGKKKLTGEVCRNLSCWNVNISCELDMKQLNSHRKWIWKILAFQVGHGLNCVISYFLRVDDVRHSWRSCTRAKRQSFWFMSVQFPFLLIHVLDFNSMQRWSYFVNCLNCLLYNFFDSDLLLILPFGGLFLLPRFSVTIVKGCFSSVDKLGLTRNQLSWIPVHIF